MEEQRQSSTVPLLQGPPQAAEGFLAWLLSWFRGTRPTADGRVSNATTVKMLMNVMVDLGMAMDYAEMQAEKKRLLAVHVMSRGHKEQALKAWATAKQYDKRYKTWFDMRENVEQIKSELVAQQQTMAVFGAFSLANHALERIAEKLNMTSLESVLSSLHEKLQNGAEMSQLLASPAELSDDYDADTLEGELDAFLARAHEKPPKREFSENFSREERVLATTEA
jgi:hypothetical protein